jgi:hypothetical protein
MHLRPIEPGPDRLRSTRGFLGLSRFAHARDGLRRFLGFAPEPDHRAGTWPQDEDPVAPRADRAIAPPRQPAAGTLPKAAAPAPAAPALRRFLGLAPLNGVPSSLSRFLGLAPLPAATPAERFVDLAPVVLPVAPARGLALAPLPAAPEEPRFIDLAPLAASAAPPRHVDLAPLAAGPAASRFIDLAPLQPAALARHVDLPALPAAAGRAVGLPALAMVRGDGGHRLSPFAARADRFVGLPPLARGAEPPSARL